MKSVKHRYNPFMGSSALYIAEAAVNGYSAIKYTSVIEEAIIRIVEMVDQFIVLGTNLYPERFKDTLHPYNCEPTKYSDRQILEDISSLFSIESLNGYLINEYCSDDAPLEELVGDSEFIKAVTKSQYDRVVTLQTNCVIKKMQTEGRGKDWSYWNEFYKHSFKVAVKKEAKVDEGKIYTIEEIEDLRKTGVILIITQVTEETTNPKDYKNAVEHYKVDLHESTWLKHIANEDHYLHAGFMAYIIGHVTPEIIFKCIKLYANDAKTILELPPDKFIKLLISPHDFMEKLGIRKRNDMFDYAKKYEKEHNLIAIAKAIIIEHSDAYKYTQKLLEMTF